MTDIDHATEALIEMLPISVWIEDFSEVKRIRDRLAEQGETDFRACFEQNSNLVHACLDSVRVTAVNEESVRLHKAPSKESLLSGFERTFTDKSLIDFREELIQLFSGSLQAIREAELQTFDGELRQVMVRVSIDPAFEDWSRVLVVIVDLTKQKAVERELRLQQGLLAETERVGQIGGWSMDAITREMVWTDEVFHIFGMEPGGAPAITTALDAYPADAREALGRAVEACLNHGTPYDLELPFSNKQGRELWTRSVGHAELEKGRVVRVVGTLQDVTIRRENEARRRKLEINVMQTQKLKSLGVMAGGIAHEFNNLLGAIIGNVELGLIESEQDNPQRVHFAEIHTAALRAAELSGQMLAYSGRGYSVEEAVNPTELVAEMIEMFRLTIPKSTSLQFESQIDLQSVMTDPEHLQQILLSLVMNGSEALEGQAGSVGVTMRQETMSARALAKLESQFPLGHEVPLEAMDCIIIAVRDTGVGMNESTSAQIFEPFFSTKFTGRGLGLSAVAGILRSRKSAISVETKLGVGTCVAVYLPIVLPSTAVPTTELQPVAPPAKLPSNPQLSGRILLADDEPAVLSITKTMLERLGYEVVTATDGREALDRFNEGRGSWSFALFDVTMPELDGIEALDRVNQLEPALPVFLSSGYDSEGLATRLAGSSPAGFLLKPFSFSDLKKLIELVSPN